MSGTTFPMSTIKIARPSSKTVWLHLLWKDFRQIWQLVIGITAIGAFLQLMLALLEQLFSMEMQGLSHGAVNVALASPTLLAVASSGILIGQERQTGCWTWSSSLPVSWQQSLLSKVLAWLAASVCTVAMLLIIAAIVLPLNHSTLSIQLFSSRSETMWWTQIVTVLIGIQVFIYLSIATLLFKDTLMAIVIAAFGLFAFHCLVVLSELISMIHAISGQELVFNRGNAILLAYFASYIVGAIGLAVTYRWRWGTGQYTSLSLLGRFSRNIAQPQRAAWQSFAKKALQPSEFSMLLQHGLRTSFWLRAFTFMSALLVMLSQGVGVPSFMFLALPAAFLASCVFGVSVFSGEQTLNRYRFFADRGVDWKKLVASHIAFPALLTFLLMVLASFATTDSESAWIYMYCIPMFVVGMFSSLVFSSPIISLTVAISVLIGAFVFSSSAVGIWRVVAAPHYGTLAIEFWIPVATVIVMVTAIRQVPQWLRKDRFKATGLYFGTMLIAGLLPSVLGLSLGFLTIPNVAWHGTPVDQIKPIDWTGGPDLSRMYNGIEIDPAYLASRGKIGTSQIQPDFLRNISDLSKNIYQSIKQDHKTWLSSNKELIEAIERGGPKPERFDANDSTKLDKLIQGSAIIAMMATKEQEWGLAIRAWKANHKLLAFCNQPALQPTTLGSRCFVWEIWYSLSDPDLRFLNDTGELEEMLPPAGPSHEQFRELLKARATLHRISRRYNSIDVSKGYFSYTHRWDGFTPLSFFPPIRWAGERQHAVALSEDLNPSMLLPSHSRFNDPLVQPYMLLDFMQNQFAARLSALRSARPGSASPAPSN